MLDRVPRLRWAILVPLAVATAGVWIGVAIAPENAPIPNVVWLGVRLFFAVSFLFIGIVLIYRLLVDGRPPERER
jgi:hypothetical protein